MLTVISSSALALLAVFEVEMESELSTISEVGDMPARMLGREGREKRLQLRCDTMSGKERRKMFDHPIQFVSILFIELSDLDALESPNSAVAFEGRPVRGL